MKAAGGLGGDGPAPPGRREASPGQEAAAVGPPGPGTIGLWAADGARARPMATYLEDARSTRRVTYGQLWELSVAWRARLRAAGVSAGTPVVLRAQDHLGYAATFAALMAAGQLVVPLAPAAPAAEEARLRQLTEPAATISSPGVARAARWGSWRVDDASLELHPPGRARPVGGAGVLLCTSGSSGAAKVVLLEERQLAHVAAGVARHHGLGPHDRGFSPLPLFHVNGEVVGALATLAGGAALVVDDRFHRTDFWELVDQRAITWVNAVPAIISVLASSPRPVPVPSGVRFVRSASAPLAVSTLRRFEELTGLNVLESYGMTEAASMITANPLDGPRKAGSVGLPVGTELRLCRPTGSEVGAESEIGAGSEVGAGEIGRVQVRGPGVISAYAAGGAGTIDGQGWLDTADLGYRDHDGYLYLVGRADDLINRGGENIYPREIEELLLADPGVTGALVVGGPDPVLGARPVAYVVPAPAATDRAGLSQRLLALCERSLSPYKVPDAVLVVDGLPVGPTGKPSRRLAVARLGADLAGAGPSLPATA